MPGTIDTFTAVLAADGNGFDITIGAPGFETFTLTRLIANAPWGSGVVRGAKDASLSGIGAAYISDVEVPQNTVVQYLLTVMDTTPSPLTVTSEWLTATGQVDHGGHVIFDLSQSSAPTVVLVNSWDALEHDTEAEKIWVAGRADPVIVSGTRRMPVSSLTLLTLDNAQYEGILSILVGGITCFAPRYPQAFGMRTGLAYLSVGRVSEGRMRRSDGQPARYLTLEVQQILPPTAEYIVQVARTWDEAIALGLTWDVLAATYTWDELAYG